jgi:hypothetical protein
MFETLVPCKSCKTPVAKKAALCPSCGRGRPGGGTTTGVFILVTIVLVIAAAWLILSVMAKSGGF